MNIKKAYTEKEWNEREEYYISRLNMLGIPQQPEPRAISNFNAKLDYLRTEASLDCAYIQKDYEKYSNMYKNAEKELFYIIKKQQLDAGLKLTEKEVVGLVITSLNSKPLDNMQETITNAYNRVSCRFAFIKRLVDILDQKQQALFVLNGIYKVECGALKMGNSNVDNFQQIGEAI